MNGEPASAPRILIVDDNAGIHRDFELVLAETNLNAELEAEEERLYGSRPGQRVDRPAYVVDHAMSGLEGVDRVKQALAAGRAYQLAFVDIRMPGIDGVETIDRIWQLDPRIQIVICTAYADYTWEELVQRLGQTDQLLVLKKPFDNLEVTLLASTLTEKWFLARQAALKLEEMERLVAQRTAKILALEPIRAVARVAERAASTLAEDAVSVKEPPLLLLVTSDPAVQEIITRTFASSHRLLQASEAEAGWQQAQATIPDLVLLDGGLSKVNTAGFCTRLKASELTSHIPVMVLRGGGSLESRFQSASLEAVDAVPLDAGKLKARAEQLLTGKSSRDQVSDPNLLRPRPLGDRPMEAQFLRRLVETVERHLADYEFDVDALAQKLALSRRQLFRKLKAVTDLTPNLFIRNLRLKHAAQLLKDSQLTVTEVTYAVGFADLKHFRTVFREQFGVLPGEYSARAQGRSEGDARK